MGKKVIFHVHMPKGIEHIGNPVVLGDREELGSWQNPIVKLHRPFPHCPTYWQSDPVTLSLSNLNQYKYAIFEGNFKFEGSGAQDNRTLDIWRSDQFDIWNNNHDAYAFGIFYYYKRDTLYVHDFAFVDYIYNTIEANNIKDKVISYQHLLSHHYDLTISVSNFKFIFDRINDKLKEKRIFLCLLLGYHIPRQESFYELPNQFPSGLLLDALDEYKQEALPSDIKGQMYTAIMSLIQHNAFQMQWNWLVIYKIAAEVDPDYTFVDRLRALTYPSDDLLAKFINEIEIIRRYIEGIEFGTYAKLAKWLIQLCHNMDSLLKLWSDVLLHNYSSDKDILKCFIDRVRMNISHDDAVALEYHLKRLSREDYRDDVSDVFRDHVLFLLENQNSKWTNENIFAIKKLLHDGSLNWHSESVIQSLELISQSRTLELLNMFSEILDDWFRNNFSDAEEKKVQKICTTWFKNLLFGLDTSVSNGNSSNESIFIFRVFQQLERMYPLFSQRFNIWRDLADIAIERVKGYSEVQIFVSTKLIVEIKQDDVKQLFLNMVKEILCETVQQANDRLLNVIFIICDCKSKSLEVPNSMSEDILYHIMTILQIQSAACSPSDYRLNILRASKFWNVILRATGSVGKLKTHSFVKSIEKSINELGG